MSFYYYKVVREPEKPPCYGFRKAEAEEIETIVKRVTRPTYSSLIHTEEPTLAHNYQYIREQSSRRRTPSACKRRPPSENIQNSHNRRYTDWEIQRLLRRIQKPTETSTYRRASYCSDPPRNDNKKTRPKTVDERAKALERLLRPTTASRAKSVTDCHLCDDDNREKNKTLAPFEYEYADDKEVEPELVEEIVERVRSPTFASTRGRKQCIRLTPVQIDGVKLRRGLPLVSGLARSETVQEIVDRLHNRKHHGYKTTSTPIYIH